MSRTRDNSDAPRLGGTAARYAAVFTLVLQGLSKPIGLLVVVLLVRLLSEEAFGAYNIYFSIIAMIGTVFSLGITNTLARFLPEYHKNHQDALAHSLYRVAALARLASNLLLLFLFWLFWEPITEFFGIGQYADLFTWFALLVLSYFQSSLLVTTLSAYLLQKFSFGAQFLFGIVKLAGYALLLYAADASLEHVLMVDLAGYVVMYIWLKIAYGKHAPAPTDAVPVDIPAERKRLLRYAFYYNFSDFGQFSVGTRIDFLFLAAMTEPITVGAYGLARKFERILTDLLPVKFFQGVVRPLFFTLNSESDSGKVSAYFQILTKLTYVCLFPLFVLMIASYTTISAAFLGGKFSEFADLFTTIFIFALLTGFQKPLMLVIQLREKADVVLKSKLFGILNILLLVALIPLWGGVGAAVATGGTVVLSRIYLWSAVRTSLDLRPLIGFVLYSTTYWLAVLAVLILLKEQIANPFVALTAFVTITGVAALPYLRGPILTAEETHVLDDILRPRERRILGKFGILRQSAVAP